MPAQHSAAHSHTIDLFVFLVLQVVVPEVCDGGSNQENNVQGNTNPSPSIRSSTGSSSDLVGRTGPGSWIPGDTFQGSDFEALEDFACFV